MQSGGLLGRLLGPLLKTALPLVKNVIKQMAKIFLITLGLTTAALAADTRIHKKILRSRTTTLIIPDKEIENIMKIIKSLKDSGLLLKRVSKTIQTELKEQNGWFLSMLLGTLGIR